ncbi:MAG TPA: hypothetical protein VI752_01120 [Candidatus Paceibacterota bacterium]
MENRSERQNFSLLEEPLRRFIENDPTLRLNRIAQVLQSTDVSYDENSWMSVTRREHDGTNKVTIGMQPLPQSSLDRWAIGTSDPSEQTMIKLSHELAHAFQREKGYESALVKFLNGYNDIPDHTVPYIELYAMLSGIGPINGLVKEPIYEEQSRNSGNLKMETLEDITELMSAYIISDEYFLYRLNNSVTNLDQDKKEMIALKTIEVCRELH